MQHNIPINNFKGGYIGYSQDEEQVENSENISFFEIPIINVNARSFYQIVNLNGAEVKQPPAIRHLSDLKIKAIQKDPLKLNHPCHSQHVARHVKLVTQASAQACGIDRRNGVIRQKLRSGQIMKKFRTKHDFAM